MNILDLPDDIINAIIEKMPLYYEMPLRLVSKKASQFMRGSVYVNNVMCDFACEGYIDLVKEFFTNDMECVVESAVVSGNIELLNYLINTGADMCHYWSICAALSHGHIDAAKWVYQKCYPFEIDGAMLGDEGSDFYNACCEAYITKKIDKTQLNDMFEWLKSVNLPRSDNTGCESAAAGDIYTLQVLNEIRQLNRCIVESAICNNQIETVKWLHHANIRDKSAIRLCTLNGMIEMIPWLEDNGYKYDRYPWRFAIDLHAFEFLALRVPLPNQTEIQSRLKSMPYDLFVWLYARVRVDIDELIECCIRQKSMNKFEFLLSQQPNYSKYKCIMHAISSCNHSICKCISTKELKLGEIQILVNESINNNNCHFIPWIIGKTEIIDKAYPKRFSIDNIGDIICAIENNQYKPDLNWQLKIIGCVSHCSNSVDIIKNLIKLGFTLHEDYFAFAASRCNMELLQYLLEIKCPCDFRVYSHAANNKNIEIIRWALKNGCCAV